MKPMGKATRAAAGRVQGDARSAHPHGAGRWEGVLALEASPVPPGAHGRPQDLDPWQADRGGRGPVTHGRFSPNPGSDFLLRRGEVAPLLNSTLAVITAAQLARSRLFSVPRGLQR